ncbi:hypothetical protein FNV43_RR17000 [Rhamnella rubrinervis]|uniref:Uncharacterized protein n=1 Tax=Rhamnella rubrinervis TaxID=2594499 RepID=A0A8K0GZV4_9ROSA|nr:hypothetical protein FNV43_RR17000 [Rhamnella rubrinervis]
MTNGWRCLLGLIIFAETYGQDIDIPIFLHFFYLKPSEEGRYHLYARKSTRLLKDAPTSNKNWKDRYFFIMKEGLFDLVSSSKYFICSAWIKRGPSNQQTEQIPKGIPLPILEVPYTRILKGCLRLLYNEPSDPLWASYPATNMGKMKVRVPTDEELAKKERKKKERRVTRKVGQTSQNKEPEPTPGGLEDSASVCSKHDEVTDIVSSLMTRHDRVVLKGMTFKQISHEVEQCTFKLAQDCQYLSEVVVKTNSAWKKKTAVLNNLTTTNKSLEEEANDPKVQGWGGQWPTPELSEDEGSEDSKISSNEKEPQKNDGAEKTPSHTRDSFLEAMDQTIEEGTRPTVDTAKVSSAVQPGQEEPH